MSGLTAREAGLASCHTCRGLAPPGRPCPRCGAELHSRKPGSVSRTWALLVTATVLYVPANVLPVMTTISFGRERTDTIMGGILYFVQTGSWPLAVIIFFASIVVPILKILILGGLLISLHCRSRWQPATRARLYRFTIAIGRWSMVDIFVVSLMTAVVALGRMAAVEPGPGIMAFALVVIATMLASHTFDPRLLWDELEPVRPEAP